jgi:hypothetical protein
MEWPLASARNVGPLLAKEGFRRLCDSNFQNQFEVSDAETVISLSEFPSRNQPNLMNKREELIFTAALQVPLAERNAYVDQACGVDSGLCERLKDLLAGLEEAGGFLEEPAPDLSVATKALRENQLPFTEAIQ